MLSAMSDHVTRLNAALEGRYELGEGSSWSFATGPCEFYGLYDAYSAQEPATVTVS